MKKLANSLVASVLAGLVEVTKKAIENAGFDSVDYSIKAHPFTITKVNGEPVEQEVLLAIRDALSAQKNQGNLLRSMN